MSKKLFSFLNATPKSSNTPNKSKKSSSPTSSHISNLLLLYFNLLPTIILSEGIGKHNVNQAVKWCKDLAANGGPQQKIEKCHRFLSRIEQHKAIMDKMVCTDMVQQAKRGKQFDQQQIDKCKRVLAKSGGKGGGKGGGGGNVGGGGKGKSARQREYVHSASSSIMKDLNVENAQVSVVQTFNYSRCNDPNDGR